MTRAGDSAIVAFIAVTVAFMAGCRQASVTNTEDAAPADAAFAAMQARGEHAMGVDQSMSTHVFDALPDGGRIELQRDGKDQAAVARIREHLQQIAQAFGAGDFSTPAFVHLQQVPGTPVMTAKRGDIEYRYRALPRGGELRIVTRDPLAVQAIHEFLAFQRQHHRAGGKTHTHSHERNHR